MSEGFQNLLKKSNISVCHKGYNTLKKHFSRLKSKIPTNKKTHIVYQIPCQDCPNVYIGQTAQYLENRLKGHKYDKKNKTALTKHESTTNHKMNYQETKILATEYNKHKREFLEMIYIKKEPESMNDRTDIKNLNQVYFSLLN